jgi:hypothetical protein
MHEVFGRMDDILLTRGYACVASSEETTTYRKQGGATVTLHQTGQMHDPIKAVVSDLPVGEQAAWNSKGLSILLSRVEEIIGARS